MNHLFSFFGRFHPLLVHLPIGILFLAFIFDLLSFQKRFRRFSIAVQPSILIGWIFSVLAVISGFSLSQEGGYEDHTLAIHRNFGIATALYCFILYLLRRNLNTVRLEKAKRFPLRFFLFIPLILLVSVTGHYGGSLTHGEDFLTEFASLENSVEDNAISKILAIKNDDEAVLYRDAIQPVLEAKCYSCHSSKKQKGDLRLDGVEFISKGGKHGAIIENGHADSSSLYSRLMLPIENEHHMPPEEKTQLSSAEIDLIKLWINEGADYDKQIKNFSESKKISQFIGLIIESASQKELVPRENVTAADENILKELRASGAIVLPMSNTSNYLSVSFVNQKDLSAQDLQNLIRIKDQLIHLKLSSTNISDEGMTSVGRLENLQWLYLDNTSITDGSLAQLSNLKKLRYLNLVGVDVSDNGLLAFENPDELEEIYLYRTKVTKEGIQQLIQKHPKLKIDTGSYKLPSLPTDTLVHKRNG